MLNSEPQGNYLRVQN